MLLTVDVAAERIGVPRASLRRAAEIHGFLVRIGRAIRIDENTLPELIAKCRNEPKERVYTGTRERVNGSFETLADQKLQQARQTAQSLKKPSRSTSAGATAPVVRLTPRPS